MPSQLAAVMSGKKDPKNMSEGALRSALSDATGKLSRGQKAMAKMKQNAAAAATVALTTAEMQGSLALASFASGYRGQDGLKVGPVDLRLMGVPLMAWGFFDCLMGNGGHHQLAIGNGLTGSYLAEQALAVGAMVADKAGDAAPAVTDSSPAPAIAVSPDIPISEGVREVLMTPAAEGRRGRGGRRSKPPRRPRRPRRPHHDDED